MITTNSENPIRSRPIQKIQLGNNQFGKSNLVRTNLENLIQSQAIRKIQLGNNQFKNPIRFEPIQKIQFEHNLIQFSQIQFGKSSSDTTNSENPIRSKPVWKNQVFSITSN